MQVLGSCSLLVQASLSFLSLQPLSLLVLSSISLDKPHMSGHGAMQLYIWHRRLNHMFGMCNWSTTQSLRTCLGSFDQGKPGTMGSL